MVLYEFLTSLDLQNMLVSGNLSKLVVQTHIAGIHMGRGATYDAETFRSSGPYPMFLPLQQSSFLSFSNQ